MSQFAPGSAFARVLNLILREGQFTAVELAIEADCSDRLIGYAASGERELSVAKAEKVARYLCRHGETRLAQVFLCPRYAVVERSEGTADGSIQDELIELLEAMGPMNGRFGARDKEAMCALIARGRKAFDDLEAEVALL